jgi:uncharacterized protein YjlB
MDEAQMEIETIELTDDGHVPNNPDLPLVIYARALEPGATPADVIQRFALNGWHGAWVNGIYPYHHYHACSHEVLANVGAPVEVQFGGENGPVVTFESGSVVIIPAGGGHCRHSDNPDIMIVGAYPGGQEDWDLKRADNAADYRAAKPQIAAVALPLADPITGAAAPLLEVWRRSRR